MRNIVLFVLAMLLGLILMIFCAYMAARPAHADGMMGGVGRFMGPTSGQNGTPPETFRITTLSGSPITTLGGDYIVTQQ